MAAECGSFFTIALGAIDFALAAFAFAVIALAFVAIAPREAGPRSGAKAFVFDSDVFFTRCCGAAEAEATLVAEETEAAEAEATSAVEATSAAEAAEATSAVETTSASEADIVMADIVIPTLYLRPRPKKQLSSIIFFLA